jgi:hypothetical protein
MDVHPPHEPIHTWRDFLLHLATITVGLLIALGLEGTVEYLHHRHIVREARENIRREIEQNQKSVKEDLAHLDVNKKSMQDDMVALRVLRKNPAAKGISVNYEFDWSSFNQSAWDSARDSGALTYMSTDEVQRYADVYDEQKIVSDQSVSIFASEVQAAAPFLAEGGDDVTPDEVHGIMHDTAVLYSRLYGLRQLVEQLGRHYAEALKK